MGMMDSMDMDGLRAFVAIVDSMSFSRAGEAIGRSQSAISLRLRRLELSLGVSLLVRRQGRVIELTPEGHKLLGYARQIIGLNDAALRDLSDRQGMTRVRLGLTADFLDMGFSQALAQVRPLVGEVAVEIETDVSERLRARCEAGELDLAFYKQSSAEDGGISLLSLDMAWAAAPSFATEDGGLPLVCFPDGCVYRRAMLASLRDAGIAHQTVLTTPSMESLRRAVGAGIGVTALPASLLGRGDGLDAVEGLPELDSITLAMAVTPGGGAIVRRMADSLGDSLLSLARH